MRFFSCRAERGFTLVEIVLVIGVIAVLSAVVIGNLGEAKKKPRDAKRISDLGQIQLALRMYKDVHEAYPTGANYVGDVGKIGEGNDIDTVLQKYLPTAFKDSMQDSDSNYGYYYDSNYDCSGVPKKVLYAKSMELQASSNWTDVCGDTPPGTNSYIIILR
ncbi:MAG: type II secretion system GspH family protein [Candidatus Kaiserbacteria bacterium]|nr:type II secretion system GspH family protein [Candidatus Kaiserbacteria bacterium]